MKITDKKAFLETLIRNVNDVDGLYDFLAEVSRCQVLERNDSRVQLIFVVNQDRFDELLVAEVNLISGTYASNCFFSTKNMEHVRITSLEPEDDSFTVSFVDEVNDLSVSATTILQKSHKVHFNTMGLSKDRKTLPPDSPERMDYESVTNLCSELLEQRNHSELTGLVEQDETMTLLKAFGGEYVLLKMLRSESGKHFCIIGIYLDLHTMEYEMTQIYYQYCGRSIPKFSRERKGLILLDDSEHAITSIFTGRENCPEMILRFPNGASGGGSWPKEAIFNS